MKQNRFICTQFSARASKPLQRAGLMLVIVFVMGIFVAGIPALALQATPSPVAPPSVRIETVDSSCQIDVQIAPGAAPYIGVSLRNEAPDPYQVQFVELQPGTPMADLSPEAIQSALTDEQSGDSVVQSFVGGPGAIQTGGAEEVILELPVAGDQPASYAAVCSIPGQENQGIVQPVQITGPEGGVTPPEANVTVVLTDEAIDMPISIRPGPQIWEVTNEGSRPHDLVLVVVSPAMTQQSIQTYMLENNGALPENVAAGGMRVLSPGKSGWIQFDLPPGQYLAICDLDQTSRVFTVTV